MTIANPASFHAEARWQRVCAQCGSGGDFHAHHVVDKQTLRGYGVTGNAQYDVRNALRLCQTFAGAKRCHFNFENRVISISTKKLTDDNIAYAFEVLRAYAYDYLRSEYDDSEPDERLIRHLATLERP